MKIPFFSVHLGRFQVLTTPGRRKIAMSQNVHYAEYETMQNCYLESLSSPVPLCAMLAVISA